MRDVADPRDVHPAHGRHGWDGVGHDSDSGDQFMSRCNIWRVEDRVLLYPRYHSISYGVEGNGFDGFSVSGQLTPVASHLVVD